MTDNSSLYDDILQEGFPTPSCKCLLQLRILASFLWLSAYGHNMPCFESWLVNDCASCLPDWMICVSLGKFCFSRYVFYYCYFFVFIFSQSVPSATTVLSYQTSSEVERFLFGRWNKNSFKGFSWRRYSSKETTVEFGPGFLYIKPPSKPSSSSRRFFC